MTSTLVQAQSKSAERLSFVRKQISNIIVNNVMKCDSKCHSMAMKNFRCSEGRREEGETHLCRRKAGHV
jgi:hypothetical protein